MRCSRWCREDVGGKTEVVAAPRSRRWIEWLDASIDGSDRLLVVVEASCAAGVIGGLVVLGIGAWVHEVGAWTIGAALVGALATGLATARVLWKGRSELG
jgi:hypothetical protein